MNEQLVVKNFGPIKDATVDFKRVTIFIGPTGGGKSTLAKLKDIFRYGKNYSVGEKNNHPRFDSGAPYREHSIINYFTEKSYLKYYSTTANVEYKNSNHLILTRSFNSPRVSNIVNSLKELLDKLNEFQESDNTLPEESKQRREALSNGISALQRQVVIIDSGIGANEDFPKLIAPVQPWYIPSERVFVSALEYSWAGLLRDDIGLSTNILGFANAFSVSRREVSELDITFLNVKYIHNNGQDFIKIPESETLLRLYETASGIQSVTPLLVLLEHLSRNTEQAQSFIIEEPELNLYPTAQQGLLNWLVEKCTKGENDLTITTHSPYILSHLNLLLYAHQVGNKDEEKRAKVKALIPEESWINPDEFAAYYVNGPEGQNGVRSLVDEETKLISQNGLDDVSGIQANLFDQLLDINSGF